MEISKQISKVVDELLAKNVKQFNVFNHSTDLGVVDIRFVLTGHGGVTTCAITLHCSGNINLNKFYFVGRGDVGECWKEVFADLLPKTPIFTNSAGEDFFEEDLGKTTCYYANTEDGKILSVIPKHVHNLERSGCFTENFRTKKNLYLHLASLE